MARYDKALENLALPENAPINWLLGSILTEAAKKNTSHFFLDALEKGRTPHIVSWNHWITEYKAALVNPSDAPTKAHADLDKAKGDFQSSLLAVFSEVWAVVLLKQKGYKKFEVLLPDGRKTPDFMAFRGRKKVKIEIKALEPPKDRIRAVAKERWEQNRDRNPSRYAFRAMLSHSTKARISEAATQRLKTIIDQLPDIKTNPFTETLDGGVHIEIEKEQDGKFAGNELPVPFIDHMLGRDKKEATLIVRTTIGSSDLDFSVPEFQAFFVKAFRSIASATTQVLGADGDGNLPSVIALVWHPPDPMVDPRLPDFTQKKMQALFSSFGLKTKIMIFFQPPEVPLELLRSTLKAQGATGDPTKPIRLSQDGLGAPSLPVS